MPSYPPARRDDVVDDYHGQSVADPYRWLEDADSAETRAWITAENALTEDFLAAVGPRAEIRDRLAALWDYARFDVPFERGGRWFQFRNRGLQDQPVLYVTDTADGEGRVLLDPNMLAADGTVAVTSVAVDETGTRLVYATSESGSDWRTWRLREVASGYDLHDVIEWSKFVGAAWRKDGSGFYYGAMVQPEPGREFAQETRAPDIRFHDVGAPQESDDVVFSAPEHPDWFSDPAVSDDDRYLVVSIQRGTGTETQVLVLDLESPRAGYRTLVADFEAKAAVITNLGSTFLVMTDDAATRGRVVAIDLDRADRDRWTEIVPEQAETLLEVHFCGGKLLCHYLRDAHSSLTQRCTKLVDCAS